MDFQNPKYSLIKGKRIKEFMDTLFFGKARFKSTKIPLIICGSNIDTHKPHYFDEGLILDAVMASISIPGIFPPYHTRRHNFIDGGTLDPVPAHALLNQCDKVLGLNINQAEGSKERSLNTISVLAETLYMMLNNLKPKPSERVFIVSPKFPAGKRSAIQFFRWESNYKIGEKEIKKVLPAIKRFLST